MYVYKVNQMFDTILSIHRGMQHIYHHMCSHFIHKLLVCNMFTYARDLNYDTCMLFI